MRGAVPCLSADLTTHAVPHFSTPLGQFSGIWLGLWVRASGGAAQSVSMFITYYFKYSSRSDCCTKQRLRYGELGERLKHSH